MDGREKRRRRDLVLYALLPFSFLFSFWVRHSPFNCGPLCVRVFAVCVGGRGSCVFFFFSCPMAGNRKVDPAKLGGERLDSSFFFFRLSLSPVVASLSTLCCLLARPKCSAHSPTTVEKKWDTTGARRRGMSEGGVGWGVGKSG